MAKINSRTAGILYVLFLAVVVFLSYGYFAGITGRTKKDGFTAGCECHGPAPFNNVNVTITGPDSVGSGETVNYSLNISGGPLVRGGTNIAVSRGDLNFQTSSGLREIDGELTHELPKAPVSGSVRFQFSYTAPSSEGTDTIFANGNSVNFDGLPYNDNWNFAVSKILSIRKTIGVEGEGTVLPEEFKLHQNYPNPFNPSTLIKFEIPNRSFVTLLIYDSYGKEVSNLIDKELTAGDYNVIWDAKNYSSGVYYYKLFAGEFTASKKMILIK